MSVSLQKGQKVDLTKGNAGLNKIIVGLGWDPVKKSGGFLGGILGGKETQIDCDASVIMLNSNNKLAKKENVVYFGNLKDQAGSVKHSGDNLTGDGDGDDEQIQVDLSKIPNDVDHLVFVVNIYDCQRRKQDFGLIQNAFIRVVNGANNQEVLKFNLSESYAGKTALLTGEVYRHNNEWKFSAMGEATNDISLSELLKRYM